MGITQNRKKTGLKKIIDEKLLKFLIVGIINTLVGTAIMFGLYNLAGCSYWLSSAANYILASILSYVLNKKFTFDYKGGTTKSSIRFILNIALCYFAAYGAAKPLALWILSGSSVRIQENVAMLVGMCIFTALNYIGQRFFVFEEEDMEYRKMYEEWVNSPALSDEEKQELKAMSQEDIFEAFYKYAEFGTAGMRGIMGLGTNRLNKYTIRMAAKGLAIMLGEGSKVVIAYDTRNHSQEFARETARVLAASGVKSYLFDGYSPVPLLSFAVRELSCDGGVVITASHNTREYNGFKVYDSTGCQMNTQMAGEIASNIAGLKDSLNIEVADLDHPNIEYVDHCITEKFLQAVGKCSHPIDQKAADDIKIVYTSLHGSGRDFILESLKRAGFTNVTLVEKQAEFNGDFPTVKKPNPEDVSAFAIAEKIVQEQESDIVVGTDPDCDRVGLGVKTDKGMVYLTGNQTGVLLIDFLGKLQEDQGRKLITTIVTSDMGKIVAAGYGIDAIETYTGFKNIGAVMNNMADDDYFMGYEESYGYLPGIHARDKDAVSATLVICQMAAYWKSQGKNPVDRLYELYEEYGYWIDRQQSFTFEGSEGTRRIGDIMNVFREKQDIFTDVAPIKKALDYSKGIDGFPPENILKFVFENGSWIAIRPSGTEPKIKFYYCLTGRDEATAEKMYDKAKLVVESVATV